MSRTDVKEAVRERYSQAARRVSEGRSCCGGDAALEGASPIISNLYDVSEKGMLPGRRCWPRSAVEILRRLRNCSRVKPSSTSVRAAASTCSFPRVASDQQAKPTASI